jgi:hypothetical protein
MDEILLMDGFEKLDRESLGHESAVDHALRLLVGDGVMALEVNRLAERPPASLNPVNAHRNGFYKIKVLGVLGEERLEVTEVAAYR